eukprot:6437976-Prymnesium_polylepis.1
MTFCSRKSRKFSSSVEPFLLAFVVADHLCFLHPLEPKTPSTSGSPASARTSTVASFGSSASFA